MTNFTNPPNTLKVADYEILMSYARLLRVVSLFPEGLPELSSAHSDPAVSSAIVEIMLADKGLSPQDYPTLETYDLSIEDGDKIAEWGLAHAFSFFVRKLESTMEAAKASGETIQKVTEETEKLNNSMLSSNGTGA